MKKTIFLLLIVLLSGDFLVAQHHINAGVLIRKTEALYWENGVGLEYSNEKLLNNHLLIQTGFISSRLGNALFGNALRQDNYLVGVKYLFRPKRTVRFDAGINTGFFHVDYQNDVFDVLPASSLILAADLGVRYQLNPVDLRLSLGYNFLSGNGIDIPGSLFPVYYQLSVYLPIQLKSK